MVNVIESGIKCRSQWCLLSLAGMNKMLKTLYEMSNAKVFATPKQTAAQLASRLPDHDSLRRSIWYSSYVYSEADTVLGSAVQA